MLPIVWQAQKTKKNLIIWAVLFIAVFTLYVFFDILANQTLTHMFNTLGLTLFIVHVGVNFVLALLTSTMLSLTQVNLTLTKKEPKGANSIPVLSFVFGLLTFGCTPCVVAFLAAVGIAFTPLTLGPANLTWKLILLVLISLSFVYILYSIHNTTCKVKPQNAQT